MLLWFTGLSGARKSTLTLPIIFLLPSHLRHFFATSREWVDSKKWIVGLLRLLNGLAGWLDTQSSDSMI